MSRVEVTRVKDLRPGDVATFLWEGHEHTGPVYGTPGAPGLAWGTYMVWSGDIAFVSAYREVEDHPTADVILVHEARGVVVDPPLVAVRNINRSYDAYDEEWHRDEITRWQDAEVVAKGEVKGA